MQQSKIEWLINQDGSQGYSVNPVKGLCPVACPYCYARRMYKRFKWDPRLRYDPTSWLGIGSLRKPSRIFVGSTIDLFHDKIKEQWLRWIFEVPIGFPQHTFIFLTKRPQNLPKWNPWPDNCWVGMSATNMSQFGNLPVMGDVVAKVKFVSFEPLLDFTPPDLRWIDWVIIGSQTQPVKHPERAWVEEIILAADKAGLPVFVKAPLSEHLGIQRKEIPKSQL